MTLTLLCLNKTKEGGFAALQGWLLYIPSDGQFHGLIIDMIWACYSGEQGKEEGRPVCPLGLYPQMSMNV